MHFACNALGDLAFWSANPWMTWGEGKPEANPDSMVFSMHSHHYASDVMGWYNFTSQLAENCYALYKDTPFPPWDPARLDVSRFTLEIPAADQVDGPPVAPQASRHPDQQALLFHLPRSKAAWCLGCFKIRNGKAISNIWERIRLFGWSPEVSGNILKGLRSHSRQLAVRPTTAQPLLRNSIIHHEYPPSPPPTNTIACRDRSPPSSSGRSAMADDVSTASKPDTATTPKLDATSSYDINVSGAPAVVTWGGHSPLSDVTCDVRRYASNNTAFIKLRATLLLKVPASLPSKTSLFLFIHPERIQELVLDEPSEFPPHEAVKKKLGQDTCCLRFTLDRPASLVGPASPEKTTPKNKSSGELLRHLQSLARETNFTVHLPAKVVTKARLQSLCVAATRHGLKAIPWQADLTCLYGGKGGRLIEDGLEAPPAEPPSYDELEPGPPMPPASQGSTSQGPSKKRRRGSDGSDAQPVDLALMEAMCRKIMGEMKAELKQEMSDQLHQLETRIMDCLEERLAEETARVEEHVDQQLLEVRDETTDEIGTRIEDEYYGVRLRLEEYVKDEVRDAEQRIIQHIESNATVSLQFNT
ncbi:hypothetical protein KVR01_004829 [Diaporthe batatas]|uniref:uncharacterized protein n=1 Tax=Diaporthe batatas TaxID=748121 RepID=UPI001D03775F|nr:uncharacterized protein KVR01_004829 [Diaporthe batatas]KAG8166277.1 hypothetical protein KVR01_004829 [Diaporthe batatas]